MYLEEMAADLDGQDWLDMDNIEQVRSPQYIYVSQLPLNMSRYRALGERESLLDALNTFESCIHNVRH